MSTAVIHQGNSDTTQWNMFEEKWRSEHPTPRDYAYIRSHRRLRDPLLSLRAINPRWPLTVIAILLACVSQFAGLMMLAESGINVVGNAPALALMILTGAAMAMAVVVVNTYRWQ